MFLAKASAIRNGETETIVMVKALQERDDNIHLDFKREIEMYHKLNHERIAKLLAICRDGDPFLLLMEYSDWVRSINFNILRFSN